MCILPLRLEEKQGQNSILALRGHFRGTLREGDARGPLVMFSALETGMSLGSLQLGQGGISLCSPLVQFGQERQTTSYQGTGLWEPVWGGSGGGTHYTQPPGRGEAPGVHTGCGSDTTSWEVSTEDPGMRERGAGGTGEMGEAGSNTPFQGPPFPLGSLCLIKPTNDQALRKGPRGEGQKPQGHQCVWGEQPTTMSLPPQ